MNLNFEFYYQSFNSLFFYKKTGESFTSVPRRNRKKNNIKFSFIFRSLSLKNFAKKELFEKLRNPYIVNFVGASFVKVINHQYRFSRNVFFGIVLNKNRNKNVKDKMCICTELLERGTVFDLIHRAKVSLVILNRYSHRFVNVCVCLGVEGQDCARCVVCVIVLAQGFKTAKVLYIYICIYISQNSRQNGVLYRDLKPDNLLVFSVSHNARFFLKKNLLLLLLSIFNFF